MLKETQHTEFKEIPNGLLFTYSYIVQKNSTRPPYHYTPEMLDDDTRNEEWVVKEPLSVYQVNTQVNKLLLCLNSEKKHNIGNFIFLKTERQNRNNAQLHSTCPKTRSDRNDHTRQT